MCYISLMRLALPAIVSLVLLPAGCQWFPPEPTPFVGPSPVFFPLIENELGASQAYVVGVSARRLSEASPARAIRASLRAETVPVRAEPLRSGPTTRVSYPVDLAVRQRSEAAVDAADTGPSIDSAIVPTEPGDRPAPAQQPLPSVPAATAANADLNSDGFVTLDEIRALHRANVPGEEIARRLTATGYALRATLQQLNHLRAYGIPEAALAPLVLDPPASYPPKADDNMR